MFAKSLGRASRKALRSVSDLTRTKLEKALDKQIKIQQKQKPQEVHPFIAKWGYELREYPNNIELQLVKDEDDKEVYIVFQSRTPLTLEDYSETMAKHSVFQVRVKQKNSNKYTEFECYTIESEVHIMNVAYSEEEPDLKKVIEKTEYRGPEFTTLEKELQYCLLDYLREMGVNEDLGIFVESYSTSKDQKLYLDWLHSIKNFVNL